MLVEEVHGASPQRERICDSARTSTRMSAMIITISSCADQCLHALSWPRAWLRTGGTGALDRGGQHGRHSFDHNPVPVAGESWHRSDWQFIVQPNRDPTGRAICLNMGTLRPAEARHVPEATEVPPVTAVTSFK